MSSPRSKSVVKGFVVLSLAFRQEDKQWLAECVELGTATFARTLKQAHKELVELVELHLNALEEAGERERFFEEHNIKFYTDAVPPAQVDKKVPVGQEIFVDHHPFPVEATA